MSGLGQWLADTYIVRRNVRAWMTAIGLGGLLLWAWLMWPPERVSLQNISAEVVSVAPPEAPPGTMKNKPLTVIIVRMPDARRVRLILDANTRPRVGSQVPVAYELYADGSETFFFNRQRWLEESHQ